MKNDNKSLLIKFSFQRLRQALMADDIASDKSYAYIYM